MAGPNATAAAFGQRRSGEQLLQILLMTGWRIGWLVLPRTWSGRWNAWRRTCSSRPARRPGGGRGGLRLQPRSWRPTSPAIAATATRCWPACPAPGSTGSRRPTAPSICGPIRPTGPMTARHSARAAGGGRIAATPGSISTARAATASCLQLLRAGGGHGRGAGASRGLAGTLRRGGGRPQRAFSRRRRDLGFATRLRDRYVGTINSRP